jgi:hypothetical protein
MTSRPDRLRLDLAFALKKVTSRGRRFGDFVRRSCLFVLFVLVASPAYAPFVELTYTEFVKGLSSALSEVAKARGLSPADAGFAGRGCINLGLPRPLRGQCYKAQWRGRS